MGTLNLLGQFRFIGSMKTQNGTAVTIPPLPLRLGTACEVGVKGQVGGRYPHRPAHPDARGDGEPLQPLHRSPSSERMSSRAAARAASSSAPVHATVRAFPCLIQAAMRFIMLLPSTS